MRFLHVVGGLAIALYTVGTVLPAAAQNWNRGPTAKEYENFMSRMNVGGTGPVDNQFWFQAGMMAGLQAAKDEYVKAGAVPLFCLPLDLQPVDLRDLIFAELKNNGVAWGAPYGTAEKIALHVVRRKFPC